MTRFSCAGRLEWRTARVDQLIIREVLAGVERRCGHGGGDHLRPGDVAILVPPGEEIQGGGEGLSLRTVSIDLDLLAELAGGDQRARSAAAQGFRDCRPLGPCDAERWRRTIDFLDARVCAEAAQATPLICHNVARMVAAAALSLFSARRPIPKSTASHAVSADDAVSAHDVLTHGERADRSDAMPLTLRRSMDYIHEQAGDEISVADIADAAGVGVRAVQLAFRQHLDTTPLRYLRAVRLARAHDDLRAADPVLGDTVTEIAAKWGFFSPGKFSAEYREVYGVPPSRTLRC